MKIQRIDLYSVDLPYSGGIYRLSGGRTYDVLRRLDRQLTCDDGTEGWGESTPFGSTYIASHAVGPAPASTCSPQPCSDGTHARSTGSTT